MGYLDRPKKRLPIIFLNFSVKKETIGILFHLPNQSQLIFRIRRIGVLAGFDRYNTA